MTTVGRGTAAHHLEKVEAPGSMLTKTAAKARSTVRQSKPVRGPRWAMPASRKPPLEAARPTARRLA